LGDLVHNETVLSELRAKGVGMAQQPVDAATRTVMITAHGASNRRLSETRGRGLKVLEATCPLVQVAHRDLSRLVREGFYPVIIGKRDHVEVRGMTEDLDEFDVVLCEDDLVNLHERPRFGVIAQTTQSIDKVRRLVHSLRERFPRSEVRFIDTVCQPTKQRQNAAIELAQKCSVVVVIGGAQSNNTRELVNTCLRHCSRVHHVQTGADLCEDWFRPEDIVGLTAGTSTPDLVIAGVEQTIDDLGRRSARAAVEVICRASQK
jgi:4-hydroxy-3-methylbut-2-enyl diphosphate reductase